MRLKSQGHLSDIVNLNSGGPQGSSFRIWEHFSQSNDNGNVVPVEDRLKFVDDLTFLEIVYLLNIGIVSYNIHQKVPAHIPVHH